MKTVEELEKENAELKEEAGEILTKFLRFKYLTDTEINMLRRENHNLKIKLTKAGK